MFYIYAYLRLDYSPYYIGKGSGKRAFSKCRGEIRPPNDKSRIVILKDHLSEDDAFKFEIILIKFFGRKDIGTGILRNKSEGGRGNSGWKASDEQKLNHYMKRPEWRKIQSERFSGKNNPMFNKGLFGDKNPMYGKKRSESWKFSMTGPNNPMFGKREGNSPNSVKCHTPLGWFNSILEASKAHKVNECTIRRRIKNKGESFREYYK